MNTMIVVVSLLIFLLWGSIFLYSLKKEFILGKIIIGATLVHEVLLVVFPSVYSSFTGFEFEKKMYASVIPEDILKVLIGELIFIFMFSIGFFIIRKKTLVLID